jgi:molecular chaperone DnaK
MELRQALEANDLAEIHSKAQALEQAAQPLAQAVYAQASQQATSSAPTGVGGPEDEVVEDADYEVIDEDEAAKTS